MATQRIDWQALKARWGNELGVLHLALLPKGAAQLFLAICDRLQWEATYRVEGYDFADWDELQEIVDLGIGGLTDTMRLSDLLGYVDGIEPLLQSLLEKDCCNDRLVDDIYGDNPTVTLEEDMTGSDIEVGVGLPPGEIEDWEAYSDYMCDAATAFAESLPEYLQTFEDVFTGLAVITSAGFLLLLPAILGPIGLPISVIGGLLLLTDLLDLQSTVADLIVSQQDWDDAMDGLVAAEGDIICAILESSTAAEASSAVRAAIEAHSQYAADALFAILPILPGLLRRMFNAEADVVAGFGGGCAGCGGQSSWSFTFDTDSEGWQSYTLATPPVLNGAASWTSQGNDPGLIYGSGVRLVSPALAFPAGTAVSVSLRLWGTGNQAGGSILNASDLSLFTAIPGLVRLASEPGSPTTYTATLTVPAGNYRVSLNLGSGNNTLADDVTITVATS